MKEIRDLFREKTSDDTLCQWILWMRQVVNQFKKKHLNQNELVTPFYRNKRGLLFFVTGFLSRLIGETGYLFIQLKPKPMGRLNLLGKVFFFSLYTVKKIQKAIDGTIKLYSICEFSKVVMIQTKAIRLK